MQEEETFIETLQRHNRQLQKALNKALVVNDTTQKALNKALVVNDTFQEVNDALEEANKSLRDINKELQHQVNKYKEKHEEE